MHLEDILLGHYQMKKNIQQFFENVYIHKVLLPLTLIHILPAYQNKDKQS